MGLLDSKKGDVAWIIRVVIVGLIALLAGVLIYSVLFPVFKQKIVEITQNTIP